MYNYCVYKHTSPNGKVYIGQTSKEPHERWGRGSGYKRNQYFYRAIKKYGWDNFIHEVLADNLTREKACQYEKALIKQYDCYNNPSKGYNQTKGGEGLWGFTHTQETRAKISGKSKGKRLSEETRRKMSESQMGHNVSEDAKKRIGDAHRSGNHPFAKKVICNGMVFDCLKDCANHYGINYSTLRSWLMGIRTMRKDFQSMGLAYVN